MPAVNSLGLPDPGDYNPGNWYTEPAPAVPTVTTPQPQPADVTVISPFPPAPPTVEGVNVTESAYTPGA